MTGFAERHQIFIRIRAAVFHRNNVVNFGCGRELSGFLAFLTEWVLTQKRNSDSLPAAVVMAGISAGGNLFSMLGAIPFSGVDQFITARKETLPA